mgnify:CR=1 FL=1
MYTLERPSKSARVSPRSLSIAIACVLSGVISLTVGEARADDAVDVTGRQSSTRDYCRKVTARAEADSALLFAPSVHAQVIRFPSTGFADTTGMQLGSGLQPRAALSLGVIDIYKGFAVRGVAQKDCLRQEVAMPLQEMLSRQEEAGLEAALSEKLAYLHARIPEQQAIVAQAQARFEAGACTLVEVHELRRRVLESAARVAEAERALAGVRSRSSGAPTESIGELLERYEQRSVEYEDSVEHLRRITPWKLNVSGGVTARPDVDYFGFVELSYNIGGLFQGAAEARATAARTAELKNARYEARHQVEALRRELSEKAAILRRHARAIEEEIQRVSKELAAIDETEAPNKSHVQAMLTLQVIDLEAERRFASTLAERQGAIGGRK